MGLESPTITLISELNAAWPVGATDIVAQGDDQIRLIKRVLQTTFNSITTPLSISERELNYLVGVTSNIQTQLGSLTSLPAAANYGTLQSLQAVPFTSGVYFQNFLDIIVGGVTSPSNGILRVNSAGYYLIKITASLEKTSLSNSLIYIECRVNGTAVPTIRAEAQIAAVNETVPTINEGVVLLALNDQVTFVPIWTSGVLTAGLDGVHFSIQKIG